MSKAKIVTVGNNRTLVKIVKKLKAKKNYYVRIRAYKTVGTTKYYSHWSGKKKVKISK